MWSFLTIYMYVSKNQPRNPLTALRNHHHLPSMPKFFSIHVPIGHLIYLPEGCLLQSVPWWTHVSAVLLKRVWVWQKMMINKLYSPQSIFSFLWYIILRVSIYFCLSPDLWGPLDLTIKEARCKWLHTIRPEVQGEVSQRWMRRAGQRLVHWLLIQFSWEGRMHKEGDFEEG